jgi:hypothetical protein
MRACNPLLRQLVGFLWTSDQPVAKASTYTEQHNAETQRQKIHAHSGIRAHVARSYVLDRATTGIGVKTV